MAVWHRAGHENVVSTKRVADALVAQGMPPRRCVLVGRERSPQVQDRVTAMSGVFQKFEQTVAGDLLVVIERAARHAAGLPVAESSDASGAVDGEPSHIVAPAHVTRPCHALSSALRTTGASVSIAAAGSQAIASPSFNPNPSPRAVGVQVLTTHLSSRRIT